MKKILICFLFLILILSGCNTEKNLDKRNDDSDEEAINLFKRDDKYAVLSGLNRYSAIYGFSGCNEQGYNHWFYQGYVNCEKFNLVCENDRWVYEDTYMDKEILKVNDKCDLIRSFVSPVSGNAKISFSLFLREGNECNLTVLHNNDIIKEYTLTKDSLYQEFEENINQNDVIDFRVSGDCLISFIPTVDFKKEKEQSLHYAVDGYFGDVHPYYNEVDGKLYMYYLSTGNQKNSKVVQTFSTLLVTSKNFLTFETTEVSMKESQRPEQDLYFVLNVFKDKNGVYRSSPGANMHACSSKSTDLITWENGNEFSLDDDGNLIYGYCAYFDTDVSSGRDPDTFYDSDDDKYYTVVINYYTSAGASGAKGLAIYEADGNGYYSTKALKAIDFTGKGDPECPQIKKINNRWYLFYSEYGNSIAGNVGRLTYRVSDENQNPMEIDWNSLEEHFIDSGDLHAAQVFQALDKYFYYGWESYAAASNVWGGYLNIPYEIYVGDNGILYSKISTDLLNVINKGLVKEYSDDVIVKTDLIGVERNIISANLTGANSFTLGDYKLGIKEINDKAYIFAEGPNYNNLLEIEKENEYNVTIIVDESFVDILVNDKYTFSTHLLLNGENVLGLNPNNGVFKNVRIYKLASYDNLY